jgi:uncharacterized protein (DUF2252 family)
MRRHFSVAERIRQFNTGRDPERLTLKYKVMKKGPFPFLRGTCHLFYEDWPLRSPLNDAPVAWLCGDLHLENFGTYKGDNGLEYFDLNDFDEAILAPCTWDVTRLATSALVGAQSLQWSRTQAQDLCVMLLSAYGDALAQGKARWVERETAQGMVRDLLTGLRNRTRAQLLEKITETHNGRRRFRYGKRALPISNPDRKMVERIVKAFAATQPDPRFCRPLDVARRIAGTGSLGVERYVVLVEGKGAPNRHALLDVKCARPSALEPYVPTQQPLWRSPAERVVAVQERVQAASPALLHTVSIDGGSYVLRELQPREDRLDLTASQGKVRRLRTGVETMARVTAWGQIRASGRQGAAVADDLITFGHDTRWHRQVLKYAEAYSRHIERDWQAFRKALADGFFKEQIR